MLHQIFDIGLDLTRGILLLSFIKSIFILTYYAPAKRKLSSAQNFVELVGPMLVFFLARIWLAAVTSFVPEPYLVRLTNVR